MSAFRPAMPTATRATNEDGPKDTDEAEVSEPRQEGRIEEGKGQLAEHLGVLALSDRDRHSQLCRKATGEHEMQLDEGEVTRRAKVPRADNLFPIWEERVMLRSGESLKLSPAQLHALTWFDVRKGAPVERELLRFNPDQTDEELNEVLASLREVIHSYGFELINQKLQSWLNPIPKQNRKTQEP